jgi:hypothetical protein
VDVLALAAVIIAGGGAASTGINAFYSTRRTAKTAQETRINQRKAESYLEVLRLIEPSPGSSSGRSEETSPGGRPHGHRRLSPHRSTADTTPVSRSPNRKANAMPNRSAKTGRYISNAAAARHPRTSVSEAPGPNKSSNTAHRSASTGRFVTAATAKRNPGGTVTENG